MPRPASEVETARLEARVPVNVYEQMQRAARLRGMTLTGYLIATAGEDARRTVEEAAVPRDRIPDMQAAIQAAATRHSDGLLFIAVCGHAGDGDLHPTTFYDKDNPLAASALEAANAEIVQSALDLGGTITGEHGVGT